jgi:hypothetical protein
MPTEYLTVSDVELVSAGMAWNGVGGPYWITGEHIADMVAAQDDPLIRTARVKLGHFDPRFNAGLSSHDPLNLSATPAFGSVVNLRTTQGGAMLVGDLIEVPAWLATAMPSAYPARSIEWTWDVRTEGDRLYTAVLTDLALLGVTQQAVADLGDITRENLQTLLEEGPEAMAAVSALASLAS